MRVDLTTEFNSLLDGRVRLADPVEQLRARYQSAKPFSHVTIDNIFPTSHLDSLLNEMKGMGREKWSNIEQDSRERTMRMRTAAELGAAGQQLLTTVHSAAFLFLLSEITGVSQLLPDPYLQGAGYAQMKRGDYFNVHADRTVAYETGLTRRLALIVFLNRDWKDEYNGKLELWNHEATRCEVAVAPLYNRTIIFEVAHPNYHGVPLPINCPPDRLRQSFILYYHTVGGDGQAVPKPRTTMFAPRFYESNRVTFKSVMRDVTPPVLARALRKLTDK